MKETTLTILENTPLTHDTYRLRLAGGTLGHHRARGSS